MNKTYKVDLEKVDWLRQDVVLASELGCSREAVRQARVRMGAGLAATPRKRTAMTAEDHLAGMDTDGLTLPELARIVGCHERRIVIVLRLLGKGYKHRPRGKARYDWTLFPTDWETKTDKDLAVIVGADNPAVVAQWRNRHGYRKQVVHVDKVNGLSGKVGAL